ncbi:MAG: HAMP domain-containing histidine kinase [Chloroflexi bacterium]|nr:HAMP domain-containing histidine kinase [Chloroflexota bacterium]
MNPFRGLQARLMAAFLAIVVVALVVSSGVFVVIRRGDQERHALDRVVASSPAIYAQFISGAMHQGDSLQEIADAAASHHDVRVLVVNPSGLVEADSGGDLVGSRIDVPPAPANGPAPNNGPRILGQPATPPYQSWRPADGTPGDGLILVTSNFPRVRSGPGGEPAFARDEGFAIVLAVSEQTVTRAWLDLMPGLGLAALIALPVAALLAIVVARYIIRPLHDLTLATMRVAEGTFDVEVATGRRDEVGRLARAFSEMTRRVGETQSQMRRLLADVSHDLKTPLTSVLGFSQALRDGRATTPEEAQRMGAIIHDEASRLTARLQDVLLLSELDAGRAILDRSEVDLGRLAAAVAARFAQGFADRGITLHQDLPPGITVDGDVPKLERALENLLDNARKFAPEGGEATISCEARGPLAVVVVRNAAPGIDPGEVERLFDRFYRRDGSRTGTNGSGLGLAIARDLVELHGGTLTGATDGDGIAFTLALPAAAPHPEAA